MTRLSAALGTKFEANRQALLIRSFELGGHTFRVRIPLSGETDAIYKRIDAPKSDEIEATFKELTAGLRKFKGEKSDTVQFVDNDIIVSGRSMMEAAKNKVATEARVVEFMKLLVPEVEGASLDDLTYKDIDAEFPFAVQLTMVEKIAESISPGYKETRKN